MARSAARWFGPTAEKKGKERREKVEVCCAAVGTDCRALFSFSFYRSGRRACRLSLCRSGRTAPRRATPRLSPLPLSYSASRSIARRRHREDSADSSLFSRHPSSLQGKGSARERAFPFLPSSLPLPHIFARSSLSSCGFLLRLPRLRLALVVGNCRYRCTQTHIHIHPCERTHSCTIAKAHCSRGEPRLFSNARP